MQIVSVVFRIPVQQDLCALISLRKNQRTAEIGNGAEPNWHDRPILFSTCDDGYYLFGFNILQTSAGKPSRVESWCDSNII
jgi:hypothetical protein